MMPREEDQESEPSQTTTESAAETAPPTGGDSPGETDRGADAQAEASAPERPPLDVTFEILKNERRRLVLEYLEDSDGSVTLGELAEHIAAYENDVTPAELNAQQRKRVYIGLYQCHLPKMADAEVVEFNQDRGVIRMGRFGPALLDFLDFPEEPASEDPRTSLLISLSGCAIFLVAAVTLTGWLLDAVVISLLAVMPMVTAWQSTSLP